VSKGSNNIKICNQKIFQEEKERLGLVFDNDGEFYMSQNDFLRNFDHLEICNLTPDTLDEEQFTVKFRWHESSFDGSWIAGNDGFLSLPFESNSMIISFFRANITFMLIQLNC